MLFSAILAFARKLGFRCSVSIPGLPAPPSPPSRDSLVVTLSRSGFTSPKFISALVTMSRSRLFELLSISIASLYALSTLDKVCLPAPLESRAVLST